MGDFSGKKPIDTGSNTMYLNVSFLLVVPESSDKLIDLALGNSNSSFSGKYCLLQQLQKNIGVGS